MWKIARAYILPKRILIAPTQLTTAGVPLLGSPCFDGPFEAEGAGAAILEALEKSLETWPANPDPRTMNRDFLKTFRLRSLKHFHAIADSVSIEQDNDESIQFHPAARHPEGGFVDSSEAIIRAKPEPSALGQALWVAIERARHAKPL